MRLLTDIHLSCTGKYDHLIVPGFEEFGKHSWNPEVGFGTRKLVLEPGSWSLVALSSSSALSTVFLFLSFSVISFSFCLPTLHSHPKSSQAFTGDQTVSEERKTLEAIVVLKPSLTSALDPISLMQTHHALEPRSSSCTCLARCI